MVKVGNSECGFLKLTPLSRTAAMAGAVSGVTIQRAQAVRHEQDEVVGLGVLAKAALAAKVKRLADSSMSARRIKISR